MSVALPSSWTEAPIGTLCVNTEQVTPDAEAEFIYVDIASVDRETKKITSPQRMLGKDAPSRARKLIKTGDTIVSTTRPNLNAVALVDQTLDGQIASTGFDVLRAPGLDPRWLGYLVRTSAFVDAMSSLVQGALYPAIRGKDVRSFTAPIAPEKEQKRIADKLDTVLTRVDAVNTRLARVAPLLKRFRQSVLAAATSGRLTEDWRSTHSAAAGSLSCIASTQQAKHEWLKENGSHNEAGRVAKRLASFSEKRISADGLPNSWCWAALEDAVLMVVDCHNKTAPYEPNGIPLVRTTNVRDGAFTWSDLRFVNDQTYLYWSKRCIPTSGDIVFTREAPMGEAAIIPADMKICLGQRTMLIRPVSRVTSSHYLLVALLDPMFKARAEEVAVGTGVKHLRVGDVSELQLPLPPTEEQTEIVRRVETLFAFADRLEARLAQAQTAATRLTPALLAKAFRGELVPQDPNDEPAAELLRRLQAERASAPKASAGRGRKAAVQV
ncbi:restriction endonuclease subunit S [Acidovorax temperans]|uniref:restriction endonuclease subunit S n=1 Tax=Acidovorax temperans TaxID=80878 RepID=UPI00289B2375|nr:restriction endonuclease subunit S [Acidovorax temperans]